MKQHYDNIFRLIGALICLDAFVKGYWDFAPYGFIIIVASFFLEKYK